MHISFNLHDSHLGFLLLQWYLPKSTSCEFILFQSFSSKYFFSFISVFSISSLLFVIPNLFETLYTCVSTAKDGISNSIPRTTLAVFLPTPFNDSKYPLLSGTYPNFDISSTIYLKFDAFVLWKPNF